VRSSKRGGRETRQGYYILFIHYVIRQHIRTHKIKSLGLNKNQVHKTDIGPTVDL